MRSHEHGLVPLGRYWGGRAWRHNQAGVCSTHQNLSERSLIHMPAILEQFEGDEHIYSQITSKAKALIEDLLRFNNIEVHSVTSRTKGRDSLERKITIKGAGYACLEDITDIAGVRIVTFFEHDVNRVVELISQEFVVDVKNSIDKREILDPDRFGYLSAHQVVQLGLNRVQLNEYRGFEARRFEIQTRSILQHAWAEIEHDLGYKSKSEVPRHIRRRFSRLAGLLELADSEFNAIHAELSSYGHDVEVQMKISPDTVSIDRTSLLAFVNASPIVAELDSDIAAFGKWSLARDDDKVARDIEKLTFAGVLTIGQIEEGLQANSAAIRGFAKKWIVPQLWGRTEVRPIHRGISLFYLVYVLLGRKGNKKVIEGYFESCGIVSDNEDEDEDDLAQNVLDVFAEVEP